MGGPSAPGLVRIIHRTPTYPQLLRNCAKLLCRPCALRDVTENVCTLWAFSAQRGGINLTFVISGSDIPTKDDHSEVDAFVKVYTQTGKEEKERIGTTDHIHDNANPEWTQVFWVLWNKGQEQKLYLVVRDHDTLDVDDDVGETYVDLDKYVEQNQNSNVSLSNGGHLQVHGTTPTSFRLYAKELPPKDNIGAGLSDAYVECYFRRGKNGTDTLFHTTSVINNEENPNWQQVIEFPNWQKGQDQYWFFKVFDSDDLSTDDFIGEVLYKVDDFATSRTQKQVALDKSDGKATLYIAPA